MTSRATLGEVRIATQEVSTNQGFKSLVPTKDVDGHFLFYQLALNKERYKGLGIGSTFLEVSKRDTARFELLVPARSQQRRIAEVLGTMDEAIEQTEALIAKQQQIRAGLMHDLFTRGVTPGGDLRPSRTEAPQLYRDSKLGWIPKEWAVSQVGDALLCIEQGWSPDCESQPATNDEWGVLKTSAVVWGGFDRTENKRLPPHLSPLHDLKIYEGDVLMTRAGPNSRVGVVALVEGEVGNLMLSDKLYRLSPKSEVRPDFLALALSSDFTQHDLESFKTGLAESQTNISQSIVRRLSMPIPPQSERNSICERMRAATENVRNTQAHLAKLRQLKQGLMQDLLTGRVRVPA